MNTRLLVLITGVCSCIVLQSPAEAGGFYRNDEQWTTIVPTAESEAVFMLFGQMSTVDFEPFQGYLSVRVPTSVPVSVLQGIIDANTGDPYFVGDVELTLKESALAAAAAEAAHPAGPGDNWVGFETPLFEPLLIVPADVRTDFTLFNLEIGTTYLFAAFAGTSGTCQ